MAQSNGNTAVKANALTASNAFSDKIMLADFGVVFDKRDVFGYSFTYTRITKDSLVREFEQAGIFYDAVESITTSLRVYLGGYSHVVAQASGLNVISQLVSFDGEDPEAEETDEDEDAEVGAATISSFDQSIYYIEYPITTTQVGMERFSISNHPKYVELAEEDANAEVLAKKIRIFTRRASDYGAFVDFSAEEEDEDLQDGLSGPRISDTTKQAQLVAHQTSQSELRSKMEATLDFFEKNVIQGSMEESISLSEIRSRYSNIGFNGKLIGSAELMQDDLAEAIIAL